MNIIFIFTYGVSLKNWESSGLIQREILLYEKLHKMYGIKFIFITFGDEQDEKYKHIYDFIDVVPVYKYIERSKFEILNLIKVCLFSKKLKSLIKNPSGYMFEDHISFLVIMKFFKFKINSKLFIKNNNINNKIYDFIKNTYNNKENLESYYIALKYLEKRSITFYFLKYLYLNFIIKNKKSNIEINHIFLIKDDPIFLYKYVLIDRERLINYILLNNNTIKNSFKIINKMEKSNNYYYCNSFSIIFFRRIRSILSLINIRILNFIFFSLFEIYYKFAKK